MLDYEFIKATLGIHPLPEVDFACLYLQSRGKQFLVDFGTNNAVAKASDEICNEFEGTIDEPKRRKWDGRLGI